MRRDETAQILAVLLAQQWSFNKPPDNVEALLAGWHMALDDLELCDVEDAVRTWIRDENRFPAVADIRELVQPRSKAGNAGISDLPAQRVFDRLHSKLHAGESLTEFEEREWTAVQRRLGIGGLPTRTAERRELQAVSS